MLRLRVQGQDVSRDEGLAELDRIGEELSELAKKSRALPDSIYYPAKQQFDKDHSAYFETSPSHAGGVVIRREDASIRYLVVTAKGAPEEWVLPKGHIEPDESAEQAARREVLEETGVDAAVRDPLDVIEFSAPRGRVRAQFFLMEAVSEGLPSEGRERNWCSYDEATELLSFREAQRLICQAHLLLRNKTESTQES
jgi:ADP-ribose pyrophosphatase YjhB (NUDIX family)